MFWIGIGIFVAVLSLVGAIAAIASSLERRRTAQVAAFAEQSGLRFSETLPPMAMEDRYAFPLFQLGRNGTAKNFLDATADGASMCLFDYHYTIGSGKNRRTVVQTVCWGEGPRLNLPTLTLKPKSFFRRLGEWLGYRTIEIDQFPEFCRAYTLQGAQEAAIRAAITPAVPTLIELPAVYHLEAERGQFILYRNARRAKSHELSELLAHGYKVFKSLESPEPDGTTPLDPSEEQSARN